VLHEATDERTPLLERLKFLAIVSSNLDEFFMKRAATLARHLRRKEPAASGDPEAYRRQRELRQRICAMTAAQAELFNNVLRPQLKREGIQLLDWDDLTEKERLSSNKVFRERIYPVLTPLVVDPSHPFPFISNLSQSLGVLLKDAQSGETVFGRVK